MSKIYFLLMIIALIVGISGMARHAGPVPRQVIVSDKMPIEFQEVLKAYGGEAALASRDEYRVVSIEWTLTKNPEVYFERRVITAIDGGRFRRETVESNCQHRQVEIVDEMGRYYGSVLSGEHETRISTELSAESERGRTLSWLVETTGLLLLLREFAKSSTKAHWIRRTTDDFDEFQVITPKGDCRVYTDQGHFIRSIKTGDVVLQFSHYQSIGGLQLPYLERVLFRGELVREMYFSGIDLEPTFEAGYFEGPTVPAEQCR